MKRFILFAALTTLLLSNSDCSKKKTSTVSYKGKLEIAALCMNYTISVTEGNINVADIVADWTDEATNKSYTNVFKLGNPCDFPATIKQGDEFYFTIDTTKGKDCAVCMAYYPTPPKALSIKVVQ
jgi:hypothetical protein